jgi:hypothetical protein
MSIVGLRNLCTPAVIYLAISMMLLVVMYIQNRNNINVYCLGAYECDVTNVTAIFIVKFIYILFWTWILNLICNSGWTSIAWLLLLLPVIMFFLLVALLFLG